MSFTDVYHWVHLNQECPATSSSRDILFHSLAILSRQLSSRTAVLAEKFCGFVFSQGKIHSSHVLNQRVNTAWSSVNNFPQIIEANFLCRDGCVTTQSVTNFGHRFGVLITRLTSKAHSSAKFPFKETSCVNTEDIRACTRFSMTSSSVTQEKHQRNS